MPVNNNSFNPEEIAALGQATLSRRIANGGEVLPLDRCSYPTSQYILKKSKKSLGSPIQGGYEFKVKGRRDQRIEWWQGQSILSFTEQYGITSLVFDVGMGHMGWQVTYDILKRNGIQIDYTKGIRGGRTEKKAGEIVCNLLEEQMDDVQNAWVDDIALRMMTSNVDEPLCFTGLFGLIDPTTNTTGLIGRRPRTNPLFQHQLMTGITKDTCQERIFKMVQLLERRANKPNSVSIVSVGDEWWSMLVDLFTGTSTVTGKADFRARQDLAYQTGEKIGITLPQNCFTIPGVGLVVNDPIYARLKQMYPTASPAMDKIAMFLNMDYLGVSPVGGEAEIVHPMPEDQRLQRVSKHEDWVMWCNNPATQGVAVMA